MKILFLLTTSLDSPYGRGRCLPIAQELAGLGHEVQILALHHDLAASEARQLQVSTIGEAIKIRYVGQMHVQKRNGKKVYYAPWRLLWVVLTGFLGLLLAGLAARADVVHVGKPHPANGLAGLLISHLRGLPLFVDCDDYEAEANRFSGRWQQTIVSWAETWLPRQATGVTVNTRFLQQRYISLGVPPERVRLVPNGTPKMIVPETGKPFLVREEVVQKLSAVKEPVVISYVGTLALHSHPVTLLLEAFDQLAPHFPESYLLLVGGGPDEAVVRRRAAAMRYGDRVLFTGQLRPEEVYGAYQLATVTVDPVHDDFVARARCPLKLMESLAAGRPVVTGDVGDRREWLGVEFEEWLVEPGSAAKLAAGLSRVLRHVEEGRWPQEVIQQRARELSWDVQAAEWQQLYRVLT